MLTNRFLKQFGAISFAILGAGATAVFLWAQDQGPEQPPQAAAKKERQKRPPKPGVATPGVRREMSSITPLAVFPVAGTPDWQVVTEDAVWVTSAPKDTVSRLDPKTNMVAAVVTVGKRPCSGLAAGFGAVWVPICGDGRAAPPIPPSVSRIEIKTNKVVATVPVGPVQGEGGIATSPDGVWLVTDAKGVLSKIDPATNAVIAQVAVPAGSAGVTYGEGYVWVSSPMANMLTGVDPKANKVVYSVEVGPGPRFVTTGAGSAWTLNQGDGTVSRVDAKTGKLIKNIEAGLPGTGGELAFGAGHVWATATEIPITEIDPATNAVVKQWFGAGGDSLRIGFNSIFLSNLRNANVWRIDLKQP